MLCFFPRGVLDEILNLIESVSEGFPSYSYNFTADRGATNLQDILHFPTEGSIQNCRPESEYDRKLWSVPSTELASIPRYAQKTDVSLDHDHISGAKTLKVADRGVLLQDK